MYWREPLRRCSGISVLLRSCPVVLFIATSGCAARPGPEVLATVSSPAPESSRQHRVYAATTRARAAEGTNAYTASRSKQMNYARFDVSVPPDHVAGEIEWPKGALNPQTSFAIVDQRTLDERTFFRTISAQAAQGDVGVFIHGYNVNFQEALYRLVQMVADANIDGVPVLFSWPSQAAISGYVADKEAVTYSRDDLASLLVRLAARPGSGETVVLAHSMGSWLLMEALRQLKLQGRDDVLARLKVFLAAPDIDSNVFETQLAVIGRMRKPITIFVSKDDVALQVSELLAGDSARVGKLDVNDPKVMDAAREKGVQVIDISAVATDDSLKHGRFSALASMSPRLTKDSRKQGLVDEAGAFVFDVASAAIKAPFRLASKIVSP